MTTLHKHKHWSHHLKPRYRRIEMNLSEHRTEPDEYTMKRESTRRKRQIARGSLTVFNGLDLSYIPQYIFKKS